MLGCMESAIRPAVADDNDALMELLWGDPSSEAAALTGSTERARQFGSLLVEHSAVPLWPNCLVAEVGSNVVGLLQQGVDEVRPTSRFLWSLVRAWGLGTSLRLLPRGWALQRVRVPTPPGCWVVHELHVRPDLRNRGVGAVLLAKADEEARGAGYARIALTVRTNNPARHLYERAGYHVVKERRNRHYERLTGAEGRLLMVKDLSSPES